MPLFKIECEHWDEHVDRSTDTIEAKTKKNMSALRVLKKFAKKKKISLSRITSDPTYHRSYASAICQNAGDVTCGIRVTRKTKEDIPPRINL